MSCSTGDIDITPYLYITTPQHPLHILYMDDLALLVKGESNFFKNPVSFLKDIGMSFGLNKCNSRHIKRGNVVNVDAVRLQVESY